MGCVHPKALGEEEVAQIQKEVQFGPGGLPFNGLNPLDKENTNSVNQMAGQPPQLLQPGTVSPQLNGTSDLLTDRWVLTLCSR